MEFPFRVRFVRNSNIKAGFSPTIWKLIVKSGELSFEKDRPSGLPWPDWKEPNDIENFFPPTVTENPSNVVTKYDYPCKVNVRSNIHR